MHTLSSKRPHQPPRRQNSYLLLKKGQFGSQNLVVTWVDRPGGEQQMHVHQAEEQAYIIVRSADAASPPWTSMPSPTTSPTSLRRKRNVAATFGVV